MKTFVIALVALVAYAAAVPASKSPYIDIYRNIIESPAARIVGGKDAERHQYPYQASLRWRSSGSGTFRHICGGSLITDKWVLTAAHCKAYSKGEYQIILGQLQQNEAHEDVQVFEVAQFIVHSGYPGGGAVAANDIALIELDRAVEITDAVQIIKIGEEQHCDKIEDAVLSGWGRSNASEGSLPVHLQWAKMPRITNQQCARDLTSILGSSRPLDKSMICIGSSSDSAIQQSACNGDSGGPLVLTSTNALVGVVSWGISPCGTQNAPSVFTRICSHYDFILEHIPGILLK